MDAYWDSLSLFAGTVADHPYLPDVDKPVWILGVKRNSLHDRDEIANDIRSRLWFTYRRGFIPIGDKNGPTTDTGWGCMHRCGQMLIGQALMQLHLGREWRWNPDRLDRPYLRILKMFEDKPTAPYSIHSIASKAASGDSGAVNRWLGPNTVAQILKKLSVNNRRADLVVYVTTEDGIVVEEIKNLCRQGVSSRNHKSSLTANEETFVATPLSSPGPSELVIVRNPISVELDDDCVEIILPPVYNSPDMSPSLLEPKTPLEDDSHPTPELSNPAVLPATHTSPLAWHPLLLILPLRLGLIEFNVRYAPALRALFKLRQCVGVIGGRPNHALWLIGCVGDDEVLCLDPHTTQTAGILGEPAPGGSEEAASLDGSFHCTVPVCLPFHRLDPSLAVGFVCSTEADFDTLCTRLLAEHVSPTLFEVHETRPRNLPPPSFTSLCTAEEWGELYTVSPCAPPSLSSPKTSKCQLDGDFELL